MSSNENDIDSTITNPVEIIGSPEEENGSVAPPIPPRVNPSKLEGEPAETPHGKTFTIIRNPGSSLRVGCF